MLEIKILSQDFNQWLEQTTEGTFATDIKQISKQQLRQIILRMTLIDYIRSAIVEATSPHSKSTIANTHRWRIQALSSTESRVDLKIGIYLPTTQSIHLKNDWRCWRSFVGPSFSLQTVSWSPSIWIASDQTQRSCAMGTYHTCPMCVNIPKSRIWRDYPLTLLQASF